MDLHQITKPVLIVSALFNAERRELPAPQARTGAEREPEAGQMTAAGKAAA
jgi:hypothetical protein